MVIKSMRPLPGKPVWVIGLLLSILSGHARPVNSNDSIPKVSHQQFAIEIIKLKSGKRFTLYEGQVVRMMCMKTKGVPTIKRVRITRIDNTEVTFTPINKKYWEQTYLPQLNQCTDYLELTTTGSVVRGIFVNAVIIAVVTVTLFMLAIVAPGSLGHGSSLSGLPFDDFHKHIRFHNRKGIQKWKMNIVTFIPVEK